MSMPKDENSIMASATLSDLEKLRLIFDINKDRLKPSFPNLYYAILGVLDSYKKPRPIEDALEDSKQNFSYEDLSPLLLPNQQLHDKTAKKLNEQHWPKNIPCSHYKPGSDAGDPYHPHGSCDACCNINCVDAGSQDI